MPEKHPGAETSEPPRAAREQASPSSNGPQPRLAALLFATALLFLTACHCYYALNTRIVPNTDEAHYMSGALSIASGLRSGTLRGAVHGFLSALVYKPPLIGVPAALLMLPRGGLELPSRLSLVAVFLASGVVAFRLFRRCVEPTSAAVAALVLLTTPMITGLTHRFYVELLLVLVSLAYLAVLARVPWAHWRWSAAAGVLLGLGMLTKLTFGVLVGPSTAWSLVVAVLPRAGLRRRLTNVTARLMLALVLAALIATPWYARNLTPVLIHAKIAASCLECYYPGWIVASVSAGPGVLVFGLALFGLLAFGHAVAKGRLGRPALDAWMVVLLLALTTAVIASATPNKAMRFQATLLPAAALLATAGLASLVPPRVKPYALATLAVAGLLISLHVSFGILPCGPVGFGDLRLLDSRFPLNVPNWYSDNHPLDRRDLRFGEVVPVIAADAAARLRRGETVEARTTELGLVVNHDYLALLSSARGEKVRYTWWPGTATSGPRAPDYIVHTRGFGALYPGAHYFEYYPNLETDVASGRIAYATLARFRSATGTEVIVYRKLEPVPYVSREGE